MYNEFMKNLSMWNTLQNDISNIRIYLTRVQRRGVSRTIHHMMLGKFAYKTVHLHRIRPSEAITWANFNIAFKKFREVNYFLLVQKEAGRHRAPLTHANKPAYFVVVCDASDGILLRHIVPGGSSLLKVPQAKSFLHGFRVTSYYM